MTSRRYLVIIYLVIVQLEALWNRIYIASYNLMFLCNWITSVLIGEKLLQ